MLWKPTVIVVDGISVETVLVLGESKAGGWWCLFKALLNYVHGPM
jgi:hypothetical protein